MTTKQILTQLVSFPVLGGDSNLSILEWIKEYLDNHGVSYTLVPNEEGTKASLHARIGPAVDGGVILSGHMDVVPVAGQEWSTDPFVLTEKSDSKLYARGSCDMKGFLACCLANIANMKAANLKKPIYLAFSYDEEIGCLAAPELAAHIKSTYQEKPAYAIIGEPSMMQCTVGQKGIVIYKTTVNGSAGHSSRIRQEVSAIHVVAKLIVWLEQKMDKLIADGHIDDRFTPPHTSIHCGILEQSGIAPNVIADYSSFQWDVRVIPKDKASDIRADFTAYCSTLEEEYQKRFPDFKIVTEEVHSDVPALDGDENGELAKTVLSLIDNKQVNAVSYAAEAGQFAEADFEAIICGPGDIAQAHRANEFISIEQLDLGTKFISDLIDHLSD